MQKFRDFTGRASTKGAKISEHKHGICFDFAFARSVFARKFQPEENFYAWACLYAGDGILKAIPEDFSLCDFSARLFFVAKIMCIVCKSCRRCSLGRCCAWCCVLTCSFLRHCITQVMTGPLLRHFCTSPCVPFNLIFSPLYFQRGRQL